MCGGCARHGTYRCPRSTLWSCRLLHLCIVWDQVGCRLLKQVCLLNYVAIYSSEAIKLYVLYIGYIFKSVFSG